MKTNSSYFKGTENMAASGKRIILTLLCLFIIGCSRTYVIQKYPGYPRENNITMLNVLGKKYDSRIFLRDSTIILAKMTSYEQDTLNCFSYNTVEFKKYPSSDIQKVVIKSGLGASFMQGLGFGILGSFGGAAAGAVLFGSGGGHSDGVVAMFVGAPIGFAVGFFTGLSFGSEKNFIFK